MISPYPYREHGKPVIVSADLFLEGIQRVSPEMRTIGHILRDQCQFFYLNIFLRGR